jgi:SAM-dependent methyltransferase
MFKNLLSFFKKSTPAEVEAFYDKTTRHFVETHGDVIQSLRTYNIDDYLNYTIKSADLQDNQIILDAGCGVGGPSLFFAKHINSVFHGITISGVQASIAQNKTIEQGVKFQQADYHNMVELFGKNYFDRIIFLESFGHSDKKEELLQAAWDCLKPGGILYIKDLFIREVDDAFEKKRIQEGVNTINSSYKFNIGNLHTVISKIRRLYFILEFIKIPEIDYSQLDRFAVSTSFQDITKIGLDPSHEDWVFPVDYLEIRCRKPDFDFKKNRELYYLNR